MTQQKLVDALGIGQQTLAHYECGRSRTPVSMLPALADLLTLPFDELMGKPAVYWDGKHVGMSRLQQQLAAMERLPKIKQQFISQMLDIVLAQARQ